MKRLFLLIALVLGWPACAATWEGPYYEYCPPRLADGGYCPEDVYRSLHLENYLLPVKTLDETDIPPSGWWWNPDQPGEGVFFEISESENSATGYYIFGVVYSYNNSGDPEWYTFGGPYEYPEDATRWRERGDLFNIRFKAYQAPADFVMGEFHGNLYRASGGAWLTGGVYRRNANDIYRQIDITWTSPYEASINVGNRHNWKVEPASVFAGTRNPQGAFLTEGVWQVDMHAWASRYNFNRPDGSNSRRPVMNARFFSEAVTFSEIDVANETRTDPPLPAGDYDFAEFQHATAWYPGVRCYGSSDFSLSFSTGDADSTIPVSEGQLQRASGGGPFPSHNLFLAACWYPHDNTMRFMLFEWGTDDTPENGGEPSRANFIHAFDYLTPAPTGEVQSFVAYAAQDAIEMIDGDDYVRDEHRALVHRYTGYTLTKVQDTHEVLNRNGIHFTRLDGARQSSLLAPGLGVGNYSSFGRNYTYFRTWRLQDWHVMSWIGQDDFSYPVEGGFYSPVPASNDAPVRSSAGWWWDPNTPGWGVSYQIFRRSDGSDYLFGAVYGYDEAGNPRWYTFQTPVNGMQTLDIEAFNFRDGRPLNYNGWRQNTRWQTVPLTISWESPTKAVFRINNHDWPMQRAVFYRGTGTPDADWLLTNTWRLQGVRMEATRNTYYAWRYGENQWKKRGWGSSGPAILRPQAVFTDSATTWSRFDLNDLVMRDRNAIKALAGASDNAVYYLSDLRYDEKFMNYMKPEEWTEAEKTNPHRLDDYYQVYRSEPLWYDEVKDAGRFLLVYEPDTTEVTLLHLGGETIMDYPNGPLGDVKLLDETVLFRGHLGSPVDQQVRFTPEVCTGCDTEQALKDFAADPLWFNRNALVMSKINTMDEQFMLRPDSAESCLFGRWRAEGLWPADDDTSRLREPVVLAPAHFNTQCEYYYGPQWYGPEFRNSIVFPDLGVQKPFEPHYHE